MRRLLINLITLYQATLSPDHGWRKQLHPYGFCRFYPTCSDYAKQAIEAHGVIRGSAIATRRVLRCHPWSAGGLDLIKPKI